MKEHIKVYQGHYNGDIFLQQYNIQKTDFKTIEQISVQ
jgi:hypothetical protein